MNTEANNESPESRFMAQAALHLVLSQDWYLIWGMSDRLAALPVGSLDWYEARTHWIQTADAIIARSALRKTPVAVEPYLW